MPSPALLTYTTSVSHIQTLRRTATDKRLRSMLHDNEIQVYYHAALAAYVATWDAYINNLVRNFYEVIADALNPRFHAIYTIAQQAAERDLDRFNTPNWENTRNLLIHSTGYDPINDWVWPRGRMSGLQVRGRLNEILRVRHSFAHGFDMPSYNWTQSLSGKVRLTSKAIQKTEAFFKNLVKVTDRGMEAYINLTYGPTSIW